jgi:hypothetical protein
LLLPLSTRPVDKSYVEWGGIFACQVLAATILDRLLLLSTTAKFRAQSYRLREPGKAGVFTEPTERHQRHIAAG